MYGKSSAVVVSGWRISRARGPQRPRHAYFEVTSSTDTEPSSGACERIHAASCWPNAVPVTIRKRSSASRVTVKSHSTPPRRFSICVYVIAPTSRATRLSQSPSRKSAAPGPAASIVARVLHVVVRRVDLERARERVLAARVVAAEAARVQLPHVEARHPLDEPLRDELAHPARAREPVGAEARRDPEAAHVGGAEDELAVGREGLRAVDETDDLHVAERGDADERVLHQLLEARPVLLEQPAVEVGRDAVEAPRRGPALVAAHHEPARLAAEVDEERRVAHRRHVERHARGPGDQVLVRHRDDRDDHSRERSDLAGEYAARIHDELRLDVALVGLDGGDAIALDADAGDARPCGDLGATAARALRERERELARVDVAVRREVRGAEDAVDRHRREKALRVLRRDELQPKAERLHPAGLAGEPRPALPPRRRPER